MSEETASQPLDTSDGGQGREEAPRADILLRCLIRMSQELGRPLSEPEIRNSVPIAPSGMSVDQFCRAAGRLGFQLRREAAGARGFRGLPAPFVVIGKELGESCLVLDRNRDGLQVFDPESLQSYPAEETELAAKAGECILMKPSSEIAPRLDWRAMVSRRVKGVLGEMIVASLVINLLALATPLFAMTLYNKIIGQQALDTLQILALGMVAVYAFDGILRAVRGYISSHTGARLDALVGSEVMHHFVHLPFRHFEETSTGVISERLRQLDVVRSFFTGQMPMLLVDVAFVSIFVAALFWIHTTLAVITLIAMPLMIGLSAIFHRRQMELINQAFTAQAAKSSQLTETVNNALTVKAMGLEAEVERRWDSRLALSAWTGFRANNIGNIVSSAGHVLQMLTSLTILYFGATLVIKGEMSLGALIAGNILATRALMPLRMVVMAWVQLQEVRAAFGRLDAIMDLSVESSPGRSAPAPRFQGKLSVESVDFAHDQDRSPVLRDVNLTVPSGTIMGIIGPSGSGKTTLVRLLQGLYKPSGGRVLVDDTDISHIAPPALRQQLGVVPQEIQLFAGTVRENIMMGSPVKDPERVMAVAKFVGAHEFIQRLPDGYDTVLSERGVGISAGQRQLIAIARALIRNPRILILDEATSDLDAVTEENLMRNLQRASRGRTVVIVSHRMAPFVIADRVALLIDGQIERVGQPAEVIAFAKSRMAEVARRS